MPNNRRITFLSLPLMLLACVAGCSGGGGSSNGGSPPTASASATAIPTPTTAPQFSGEQAAESDSVVDAIGVDTHFDATGDPYVTAFSTIEAALVASGIRHIRDGSDEPANYGNRLTLLGAAGINHSIALGSVNDNAGQISSAVAAQVPYVDFIEPENEFDLTSGTNPQWASQIVASQQLLYSTVRSNPQYNNILVLGPSLSNIGNYAQLGNISSISDAGNLHDTTCNLNPGTSNDLGIAYFTSQIDLSTSKPIWTTEIGYNDDMTRPCSIPDSISAKYIPRTVTERFLAGEPRLYFYQFADQPSDPIFGGMGLIDQTGAPKPQYTSLVSMISILSDRGSAFSPAPLAYSISGATQNLNHLLVQKRDGTYILMLWLELPAWQSTAPTNIGGVPITVAPQNVTIATAQPHATATLYQYNSTWALVPTSLAANATSYKVSIGDSIAFLILK